MPEPQLVALLRMASLTLHFLSKFYLFFVLWVNLNASFRMRLSQIASLRWGNFSALREYSSKALNTFWSSLPLEAPRSCRSLSGPCLKGPNASNIGLGIQFSSIQSLSHVRFFATPWTTALQASLSITSSRSSPKPMSTESVMPSNHIMLCYPLLLLPPIFPSIRVFSNESALRIKWPKC